MAETRYDLGEPFLRFARGQKSGRGVDCFGMKYLWSLFCDRTLTCPKSCSFLLHRPRLFCGAHNCYWHYKSFNSPYRTCGFNYSKNYYKSIKIYTYYKFRLVLILNSLWLLRPRFTDILIIYQVISIALVMIEGLTVIWMFLVFDQLPCCLRLLFIGVIVIILKLKMIGRDTDVCSDALGGVCTYLIIVLCKVGVPGNTGLFLINLHVPIQFSLSITASVSYHLKNDSWIII